MPIFRLTSTVTVSAYTVVEADTLAEAITQAEDRDVVIGGVSSGASPDEDWVIEDADGSPQNIGEE